MLQTLRNRRNRKGFTLAELLIVVAIIAVLVAIAVPLFVGALNDAEKRVGEANCRAVRGAAISKILTTPSTDTNVYTADGKLKAPWKASATVDANGNIATLAISCTETTLSSDASYEKVGTTAVYKIENGSYLVEVLINELSYTPGT